MNDDLIYLGDILDRIERIESYTQEGKVQILSIFINSRCCDSLF